GPVAMRTVFHHYQWHTGGDDAGHRPDSAEAVTGLHDDPPSLHKGLRRLQVSGPAFVCHGPKNGAAHGATHGVPPYGWTGVQEGVRTELRQQLTGRTDSHQVRSSRIDTLQRLLVGGIYGRRGGEGHICLSHVRSRTRKIVAHYHCERNRPGAPTGCL